MFSETVTQFLSQYLDRKGSEHSSNSLCVSSAFFVAIVTWKVWRVWKFTLKPALYSEDPKEYPYLDQAEEHQIHLMEQAVSQTHYLDPGKHREDLAPDTLPRGLSEACIKRRFSAMYSTKSSRTSATSSASSTTIVGK
ncbi:hypothetical protein EYC80_007370 [Monilinia laxa]|uniref:Uncharacterized protein n=1 Tax=Monilinia laxa TaxID=61186 RepID=A0A5N6JUG5_MONLA|nr:hypothetical protein EYC80_007370 [Monilinia laxa]